ncbi:MAG: hypothetical protein J6R79_03795 [Bacteroidaceae bacterium]|nr:hypothetical protein [Bacteroidaceae bacterium]
MASFEEEILLDAQHDADAVAYMLKHIPADLQEKFTDEDLYYCLDLIETYLAENESLTQSNDEYIEIDLDEIASYIVKTAAKDKFAAYETDEIFFVVQAYFDFEESEGNI